MFTRWWSRADKHHEAAEAARRLERQLADSKARVRELAESQAALLARVERAERAAAQARLAVRLNERDRESLQRLDQKLDADGVRAHVASALARTAIEDDPFPHAIVSEIFPEGFYQLLCRSIPPPAFFGDRDPIKQNLRMPVEFAPELTRRVWRFVDEDVAGQVLRPLLMEKFGPAMRAHAASIFGDALADAALALPQAVSGGRLMLRRPGYHLAPHRDPKRAFLTCLLYLPGKRDLEFGTDIFRVTGDAEAPYTKTYYPEEHGARCELVKTVPCRRNSALVFLNSHGAHGATIPADAEPAGLERYSYQFYVGPAQRDLDGLIARLPAERRRFWASADERGQG